MTERPAEGTRTGLSDRLGRTRFATRLVITVERLWPLLLPLVLVAAVFAGLSWFGVFRLFGDALRIGLAAVLAILAILALVPLRRFRGPSAAEIDRRIETANRLEHTPVLVQGDRIGGHSDPFAEALWREHQRRMADRLRGLGSDLPRTRVPERDPWGIRAVAGLLLACAFAFSFGPFGGTLSDAWHGKPPVPPVPPRVDAWVTPPAYTGKAPIFLTAEANRATPVFTVPAGSDVTLRVTGGSGGETLAYTDAAGTRTEIAAEGSDAAAPPAAPVPAALRFAAKLDADGTLSLDAGDAVIEDWHFAVMPDKPPVIRFSDEPRRARNGALELAYEIEDDYGAATATAEFELVEAQAADAKPLYGKPEMPLSLPRRNAIAAKASHDLTEHVWAGQPVRLTLKAVDAAGQEAVSETKTFRMPEYPFANPLAKAVVEQRRVFSLDANRKRDALDLIDAITLRPEDTFDNPSHYLGLMAGRTRLVMADTDDKLRETADYMWQMALQIENGNLSTAQQRLRQAQEALKQALQNGAGDEEIERLMQELREAMNALLREFAERSTQNPSMAQEGQELRQSDLERMLDQIENLAKSGNRDTAEQLLSQLEQMMNNLRAGRQQQPSQGGEQGEMRRQMNKLGEIMRRQQELMNETFRLDQMQRGQQGGGEEQQDGQGQQGEQGKQPGQGMSPQEFAEALKQLQDGQGQLQNELEGLKKDLEDMGLQPGEGFGEAGEAMGEAEGALGRSQGEQAVGEQGRALEALRRGAQDMMQQMQAMQDEEGDGRAGGRQRGADRDPLDRPRATTGPDFGDSVKVPDEIDIQRARQILEAIRKRLGNALSPELERDYLERLLQMR